MIWLSFKFVSLTEGKSKIFCCNHSDIIAVRIPGYGVGDQLLHIQCRLTFRARGFDTSGNNKTADFRFFSGGFLLAQGTFCIKTHTARTIQPFCAFYKSNVLQKSVHNNFTIHLFKICSCLMLKLGIAHLG